MSAIGLAKHEVELSKQKYHCLVCSLNTTNVQQNYSPNLGSLDGLLIKAVPDQEA